MGTACTNRMMSAALFCAVAALPSLASAKINLEWRVSAQTIRVGDTVEAALYAVSDDETNQSFTALDVVFVWDPEALELTGKTDNGPAILLSSFPNDQGIDGLNADCGPDIFCEPYSFLPFNDGDALFQAYVFLPDPESPLQATPQGLLITTIVFTAIAPTLATELRIVATAGKFSSTKVLNGPVGGNVTGGLSPLTLSIVACGTRGDFDGNCRVDLDDVQQFGMCLTGPGGGAVEPPCQAADFDDNGHADLRDIAAFQSEFTGP